MLPALRERPCDSSAARTQSRTREASSGSKVLGEYRPPAPILPPPLQTRCRIAAAEPRKGRGPPLQLRPKDPTAPDSSGQKTRRADYTIARAGQLPPTGCPASARPASRAVPEKPYSSAEPQPEMSFRPWESRTTAVSVGRQIADNPEAAVGGCPDRIFRSQAQS